MLTKQIHSPDEAAKIIRQGGLVAFPTETVFGLGVDATNEAAVARLFAAKGRPSDNPLIVHVSDRQHWALAASELTPHADLLLTAFSPGPITVVLPKLASISSLVTAGLDTVGLRVPNHPVAHEILRKVNVPVAAPSANRSGRPSSTTWKSVLEDLDGRVDAVFCEDSPSIGIESTVIDCCGPHPVLLRPGAITLEQVRQLVQETQQLPVGTSEPDSTAKNSLVKSPGLLHPHYQPRAQVRLIESPSVQAIPAGQRVAYCGMQRFDGDEVFALSAVFGTVEEYAAGFYEFLREVDRQSISTVLVQAAPNHGIGTALLDRQRRAAGG